jgi:membrane protease YdiL (CAAX protease family)
VKEPGDFTFLSAWLTIVIAGGLAAAAWRQLHPNERLLGPKRTRYVSWGGFEIGILTLIFLLVPTLVMQVLVAVFGPRASFAPDQLALAHLATLIIQITITLLLLRYGSGARLYQLGITTHRLGANLVVGYLVWLAVTPVIFGVHLAANAIYLRLRQAPTAPHPFIKSFLDHPNWPSWWAIFATAVVGAAIVEELLFRGLLLRWLAARPNGAPIALIASILISALLAQSGDADRATPPSWIESALPIGYVLVLAALYPPVCRWLRRWTRNPSSGESIYVSSVAFAAAHSSVWPTPIPLFVLGIALGVLATRTQSLAGPIAMHALFNLITCLALLFGFLYHLQTSGSPTISALAFPPSISTSSWVPTSLLPRRTYPNAIADFRRGEKTDDVTCPTSLSSRQILAPAAAALSD